MAKNNVQSNSEGDFDLESNDEQPAWDIPQLLLPSGIERPNTPGHSDDASDDRFLELVPLTVIDEKSTPTVERETLRAVLSQSQLDQLMTSVKSGNHHSEILLSQLTSSRPGVSNDDPIWNAVSYLAQEPRFAGAIQMAALHAYTQRSNSPIFKVIAEAAEDPSLAAQLRYIAHHGIDSAGEQTQRMGLNVLLSMPKTWNDGDLKMVSRGLSSETALQFHDASFRASSDLMLPMKKSLTTSPQLDEQQTKMLLLGIADPRTIGTSVPISISEYLPSSSGKPAFPLIDDSVKSTKSDVGAAYKHVFKTTSPYEEIVVAAKPLIDSNNHTDTRYVDAIIAGRANASEVGQAPRTSHAIFASWGMSMSDADTRTKLGQVAAKLGEQQVRNIDMRIAVINALDPDVRKDITGTRLPISRTQIAGQLLNGSLTDVSENAYLLDAPADGVPVEETIKQKLSEKTTLVEEVGDKLFDSSTNKSEAMAKLMSHTESGVTLANRVEEIFTCKIQDVGHVNGTERFRQTQASMAHAVHLGDNDIRNLVRQLGTATQERTALSLAGDSSTYQSLVNDGKRDMADLFAVGMLDKYGTQAIFNLNPSLWTELTEEAGILHRTHEKGLTQFSQLPQWSANGNVRFDQALDCLSTFQKDVSNAGLDREAIRKSALQALDRDDSLIAMTSVASIFAAEMGDISELYDAASKGTKYDNYVDLVREKARRLEQAMDSITPEHIDAWKARADEIEQTLKSVKDGENRVALEKRLTAIEAMIDTFDPEKAASLKEFLGQIQSRDFDADTLSHWLKANSIVIVATSIAVTATLMTYGAASPLVAACLSAGAALSVSQITKESLYLVNHHVGDTGFGNYNERSYAGAWASKNYSKFEDLLNKSGERTLSATLVAAQKAELAAIKSYVTDVVGPLTAEYAVNVVASLATIGIVRFSQGGVESLSPTGLRALVANPQSARLLEVAARTENESARRLLSSWLTKASLESGRELIESVGEESLSAAATIGSRDLGIQNTPSGFIVSTAIAMATSKRGSNVSVNFADGGQVRIHPDFEPAMMRQLVNDGHKVVRNHDGSFVVSSYSDPTVPGVTVSLSRDVQNAPVDHALQNAAKQATPSESLRMANEQLRAQGMTDAKMRRDFIQHNFADVLASMKAETKAELAQRISAGKPATQTPIKFNSGTVADVVTSAREKTSREVHASILTSKDVMREAVLDNGVPLVKKQSYKVRVEKVQEDGFVKTLEAPDKGQIVKAGQFIVTRIDENGEVIYEPVLCEDGETRLMRNQWPAAAIKNLTKTYHNDQDPLVAPEDPESKTRIIAQTEEALNKLTGNGMHVDLWTRVDAPPVAVARINASIKVVTTWGGMAGKAGDWLSNYDYKSGEPGRDFAIISATSFRQTYEANDEQAASILSRIIALQPKSSSQGIPIMLENHGKASASLMPSQTTSR